MRKFVTVSCLLLSASLVLSACSSHGYRHTAKLDPFAGKGSPYYKGTGKIPFGGGHYQLGSPYQVAGRWFTPREQPDYDKVGLSSWYGEAFHRRQTSNGEWFDMATLTAAHATLPLPSYAKVTNLENGKTIIVRINDRGPFVDTRVLDVSKRVAEVLGYKQQGTAKVRVQYIGPAPLNDNGSHLMAMNHELKRGTPLRRMIAAANRDRPQDVQVADAEPAPAPVQRATYADEPVQQPDATQATATNYFVQVGSFADPDNVERIRQELIDVGPVQIAELAGNNGPIYRVRVGPLHDADEAQIALNQVYGFGLPDAHVIATHLEQASLQ
jgi:rare lipoprotein A